MAKKQITIPIFVPHQGCPHQCAFCNQYKVSGHFAFPDTNFIKNEILKYSKTVNDSIQCIEIAFFGGSFTGIKTELQKKLLSTVQPYLDSQLIKNIRISTRPDYINKSKLDLLKSYHVKTIELGVQSFNNNILQNAKRGHSSEDVYKAIEIIKEYGFNFIIQLMPGLPGDTDRLSLQNAIISSSLKPAGIRIYPTVILKDTLLEKLYYQEKFKPLSLEEAVHRSSLMLKIFNDNKIPVIRMGLHPIKMEELDSIITGPYHTAFGFLVKSRLKRNLLEMEIKNYLKKNQGDKIYLKIPYQNKEEYIGEKKQNINYLQKIFTGIKISYAVYNNTNIQITGVPDE